MGDRVSASVQLGGTITSREQFDNLIFALEAEDCGLDWCSPPSSEGWRKAILAAAEAGETLTVTDTECNYGTMEHVEGWANTYELPFIAGWDQGGGFGAGQKVSRPDLDLGERCYEGNESDPAISVGTLQVWAKEGPEALAAKVQAALLPFDEFPPLSIAPDVLAEIRAEVAA